MYLEVTTDLNQIARQRWSFRVELTTSQLILVVENYVFEQRVSTRHKKWTPKESYSRLSHNALREGKKLKDVNVPQHVLDIARSKLMTRLYSNINGEINVI